MMVKLKLAWPEYLHDFLSMFLEEDEFSDEQAALLLAYTLNESPFRWFLNLAADNMLSFKHLCDLVEDTFCHFDPNYLDRNLLQ